MPSIVFCLLLSCFTFHLGFVHPLQDVAFHFVSFTTPMGVRTAQSCSMPSIGFCRLPSCSRWFPPPLLCRLAIFCLVVTLISSLSLVDTSVVPHSCYISGSVPFCFGVYPIMSIVFVLFLTSERCALFCSFKVNIFLSVALWAVLTPIGVVKLTKWDGTKRRQTETDEGWTITAT